MAIHTEHFDAIVVGAGQAGVPLARALATAGRKTALVEREYLGGTCINTGCTPTKTLIASGRVAYLAGRSQEYGLSAGPVAVDMPAVRQRKRDMVVSFRAGTERRVTGVPGLEVIRGEACFAGEKLLEVRTQAGEVRSLTADLVFLNTGTRPSPPALPGLETVPALDSTTIMELDVVPEHLLVLGGGYVGVEFGQLFRRLGSRVTLVQRAVQLVPNEDADLAEALADLLREDGLEVLLDTQAECVNATVGGGITLHVRNGNGASAIAGTHLLVATGRVPNTEALNLPAAGVQIDAEGFITVDDRLQTNVQGIYALGDVNGGPAFTHVSYDDYRVICANLLSDGPARTTERLLPYVVYTDPQLGRVGLSERAARELGRRVRVARMPMNYVSRAVELGEARGLAKAVVDAGTGQILGAAVLGAEGGELMAMIEIAMLGKLHYTVLRDAIFAHPSLAEGLNTLFSLLGD